MLIRTITLFLLMSISALAAAAYQPGTQETYMSELRSLGADEKASLLKAREAVWRAWFAGDQQALKELLPPELITLDGPPDVFGTLESNLRESASFAKSGGKLVRLAFPRTDIQAYGRTAIIYTTYELEMNVNGQVSKEAGRATEVFVRRGERWLNTGWQLAPNR